MKYLLTLLILGALACKKKSENKSEDPTATNTVCATVSGPNINWTVTLNIPNPANVRSLSFKVAGTLAPVYKINNPMSKTYTHIQPGKSCPSASSQAYYFYEWVLADSSIKKEEPFQVFE